MSDGLLVVLGNLVVGRGILVSRVPGGKMALVNGLEPGSRFFGIAIRRFWDCV